MSASQIQRVDSNDLWETALLSLSKDDRLKISMLHSEKLEILSELHALTSQEIKQSEKRRLTYRRKTGETVIIRDLFAKVAKWIDHFKAVGDIAIQYDPGHAALPWAGVRFLLQIAVSDINAVEYILEHAALLAEIICRYKVFEELFLRSPSAAVSELKRALVTLYTKILIYLVQVKAYFNKGTLGRSVKNALLISPNLDSCFRDIQSAQEDTDRCTTMVNIQSQLEKHSELKDILETMKTPLARSADMLEVIKDELDVSKRSEILQWISTEPYENHHRQIHRDILRGTGQWLLKDPTYEKWKNDSASSILWLHGIPGSGKTNLVSHVIADAVQDYEKGLCPLPLYFYCSRNPAEPGRSNPRDIVASLLRQLARINSEGSILEPVTRAYQEQMDRGFSQRYWELDQCCDLIMQLLPYYPTITIIIDALDECDPEKRDSLLETLETILQDSSTLVKIFVSSRDDQDIVCSLEGYPNLVLSSDKNSDDISQFVRFETDKLISKRSLLRFSMNKDELRSLIIEKLNEGADGMFRWAALQLQTLCEFKTDKEVRERVGKSPPKLEDLYRELLDKMEQHVDTAARQYTRNVFSWLLCAQETLNTEQFVVAISKGIGLNSDLLTKDHIVDLCCNFVVFDSTLDTFRFAHLSVREFLEKQDAYQPEPINFLAAEICLLSLIGSADTDLAWGFLANWEYSPEDLTLFQKLYQYACRYWGSHSQRAGGRRMDGNFQRLLLYFTANESDKTSPFYRWETQVLPGAPHIFLGEAERKLSCCVGESPSAILAACCFDLVELLQAKKSSGELKSYGIRSVNGRTHVELALQYASPLCIEMLQSVQHVRLSTKTFQDSLYNEAYWKELVELHSNQHIEMQIDGPMVRLLGGSKNGLEVLKSLMRYPGSRFQAMEDVLEEAVCHEGIFDILRNYLGDDFRLLITEDMIKAAIQRNSEMKVVLALLEHADPDQYKIENLIEVATMAGCSVEVFFLLLKKGKGGRLSGNSIARLCRDSRRGWQIIEKLLEDSNFQTPVTRKMIDTVVKTDGEGLNLLKRLWDHHEGPIEVTEDWLEATARSDEGQPDKRMAFLLDNSHNAVQITEDVLLAAAENRLKGPAVMAFLLDRMGNLDNITRDVIVAATQFWNEDKDAMEIIWNSQGKQDDMAEEVLVAAATNWIIGCDHLTTLLPGTRFDQTQVTENVLIAAAENIFSGNVFMKLLLDPSMPQISVTADVFIQAAGNTIRGYEIMRLLIEHNRRVFIGDSSEGILVAAAGNRWFGCQIMSLLLDVFANDILITQPILRATCCNDQVGFECLRLLLDQWGHQLEITEDFIQSAAQAGCDRAILRILLEQSKTPLKDPQKLLKALIMGGRRLSIQALELLCERYKECMQATEDIIISAAEYCTGGIIKMLLDQLGGHSHVTMKVIQTAARHSTKDTLELLFDRRGESVQADHAIFLAAAKNIWYGAEVMELLLKDRNERTWITPEIVTAAAENDLVGGRILHLLQQYDSKQLARCITDRAAFLASCNGQAGILDLFKVLGFKVTDEHFSISSLRNAVNDNNPVVVQELIKKGIYPDHPDRNGQTPLSMAVAWNHAKVVRILLRSGDVDVNSRDNEGRQPIHYAAGSYTPVNSRIIRYLLQAGSTVDTADLSGKTPEDWARIERNLGIYRCLMSLYAS